MQPNSTIIASISARSYAVSFGEAIAYKAARQRRRPHDAYDGSTTVDRTYEKEYHNCYDEGPGKLLALRCGMIVFITAPPSATIGD
jgi:hypothetical protein